MIDHGQISAGGGASELSLDEEKPDPPSVLKWEVKSPPPFDSVYNREWAIAVLRRASEHLVGERYEQARRQQYEILKPWLNGDAATELGVSENVIRASIHRLRKRFRKGVRNEIAQTVETEEEISTGLNYLIEVLSSEG